MKIKKNYNILFYKYLVFDLLKSSTTSIFQKLGGFEEDFMVYIIKIQNNFLNCKSNNIIKNIHKLKLEFNRKLSYSDLVRSRYIFTFLYYF